MKRYILPFMLIVFLLTGCICIHKTNKIVIGIDDDFAPLSFHNENNVLIGFDIDLAKEACKRMCMVPEFKPINWDNKRKEITSGGVDMIWNGLDITEKRKEYMIFSKPYMEDRQIVLVRKDSDFNIASDYDLADKIVGVQAGSVSHDYISQNKNIRDKLAAFRTYDKLGEVIAALKSGEIEVCICDELVGRYEVNNQPNQLELINAKIGLINEMGIGFPKDKIELRDKVQAVFDEMVKDGTARKISIKWFDADLIKAYR